MGIGFSDPRGCFDTPFRAPGRVEGKDPGAYANRIEAEVRGPTSGDADEFDLAIIGNPRSFHKKFKFIVEIDDVGHAGFQKCSELSVEVANVQYFEGGSLIPNKSPGRLTFADVTLERGATQDRDLFDWFQDVAITSSGLGLTDVNYKRNLDIVQQDRDGSTLRRWSLSRAWPVKFVAGDWDNEADENVIESVTLTFDFFELVQ